MEVTAHRVAQVGIMATLQHGAALMVSGNLEESDALVCEAVLLLLLLLFLSAHGSRRMW